MMLAQRNDLRESKGQQVARFLGGIKPQFRDKIWTLVLKTTIRLSKREKQYRKYNCKMKGAEKNGGL